MGDLNRLIRNIKKAESLVLTNRLDRWLMDHPEGITADPVVLAKVLGFGASNSDRSARFGASSRGSCLRAQMFNFLGFPQNRGSDPRLQNVFNDGTWRHIRWQMMLWQAGLVTDVEVPYALPERRLKVSLDAENRNEGWLFELKGTSNLASVIHDGIPEAHLLQVHTCMLASGLDTAVYIAEDKRSQEWKEIVVRRDEQVIQRVIRELDALNRMVEVKKLPKMLGECESAVSPTRKRCPFGTVCATATWPEEDQPVVIRKGPRKQAHHH